MTYEQLTEKYEELSKLLKKVSTPEEMIKILDEIKTVNKLLDSYIVDKN